MSTAPPAIPVTTRPEKSDEVRIYQHSSLLYWWPVWVVSLILCIVTLASDSYLAFVPGDAEVNRIWQVQVQPDKMDTREGIILPPNKHLVPDTPEKAGDPLPKPEPPKVHMSRSKNLGVIFAITLLLTILISSVSVRGVWSIVVIVSVVLLVVLFALLDWWGTIAEWFFLLRIHINAAGYGFIGITLLIMWAATFFFFDRRTYVVFSPGSIRIREAVGQGEKQYDTVNVIFHKQQNDFFKHWIWGLGAGDLEIVTAKGERFEWHNVTFVGHKVRKIEDLLKTREVV